MKDPHKQEREKLTVDSLQVMTVQNLKFLVAEKLSTEAEQLSKTFIMARRAIPIIAFHGV